MTHQAHDSLQSFLAIVRDRLATIGLSLTDVEVRVSAEREPSRMYFGNVRLTVYNGARQKFTDADLGTKLTPLGFYEVYLWDATEDRTTGADRFIISANLTGEPGVAPVARYKKT